MSRSFGDDPAGVGERRPVGTDPFRCSFVSVIVSVLIVTIIEFSPAASRVVAYESAGGQDNFCCEIRTASVEPADTKVSAIPSSNCCFA